MNRSRFRAAFGAAAVVATLLASGAGAAPALAATTGDPAPQAGHSAGKDKDKDKGKGKSEGDKSKDKGKGGVKDAGKLAKAIRVTDGRLARVVVKAERLGADLHGAVSANVAQDRALLSGLTTVAEVRDLQPENYEQVVAGLRKVEKLTAQVEVVDPALAAGAAPVVEQLLAIRAGSNKDELRAAKKAVGAFKDLVEEALTGAGSDDEDPEDEVDDPDEPGTEGALA